MNPEGEPPGDSPLFITKIKLRQVGHGLHFDLKDMQRKKTITNKDTFWWFPKCIARVLVGNELEVRVCKWFGPLYIRKDQMYKKKNVYMLRCIRYLTKLCIFWYYLEYKCEENKIFLQIYKPCMLYSLLNLCSSVWNF